MSKVKKLINGLLFGLMLQLAVGPTCLYLLNISLSNSFITAFYGIIAVILVDAFYIILAILGISKFLNNTRIKLFKVFGGLILIIFALTMILSYFNLNIIPKFHPDGIISQNNVFFSAALLTLSNPLTIIFWSGIFTSKIIENNYSTHDLILFSTGCLTATLLFLSLVSGTGTILQYFITEDIIKALNFIIGIIIFIFGIKLLFGQTNMQELG